MMANRVVLYTGLVILLQAMLAALLVIPIAQAEEPSEAPVETSGDIGYSYRSLISDQVGNSHSHQGRVSFKLRTWLWQPWMATVDLGLRGTLDLSATEHTGTSTDNTATIKTGDLNLGILPQSRTRDDSTWSL